MISGHQQFFYSNLVGRIFFPFFPISFLLQLCCTQFFSDKSFQEIFFKSPIPPQELNDRLLIVESITLSELNTFNFLDVCVKWQLIKKNTVRDFAFNC